MKHFIEILLLVIPPLAFKLWRDRNGRKHPDPNGVLNVAMVMYLSITLVRFISLVAGWDEFGKNVNDVVFWYVKALAVSYTGYLLLFPPFMNFVRVLRWQKGLDKTMGGKTDYSKFIIYCLDHLSDTAIPDKWKWYRALGWKVRIISYFILFLASIVWFIQ